MTIIDAGEREITQQINLVIRTFSTAVTTKATGILASSAHVFLCGAILLLINEQCTPLSFYVCVAARAVLLYLGAHHHGGQMLPG